MAIKKAVSSCSLNNAYMQAYTPRNHINCYKCGASLSMLGAYNHKYDCPGKLKWSCQ